MLIHVHIIQVNTLLPAISHIRVCVCVYVIQIARTYPDTQHMGPHVYSIAQPVRPSPYAAAMRSMRINHAQACPGIWATKPHKHYNIANIHRQFGAISLVWWLTRHVLRRRRWSTVDADRTERRDLDSMQIAGSSSICINEHNYALRSALGRLLIYHSIQPQFGRKKNTLEHCLYTFYYLY